MDWADDRWRYHSCSLHSQVLAAQTNKQPASRRPRRKLPAEGCRVDLVSAMPRYRFKCSRQVQCHPTLQKLAHSSQFCKQQPSRAGHSGVGPPPCRPLQQRWHGVRVLRRARASRRTERRQQQLYAFKLHASVWLCGGQLLLHHCTRHLYVGVRKSSPSPPAQQPAGKAGH